MKLPIKFKKLNDKAAIPNYATEGSAGLDLTAVSEKMVMDGAISYIEYSTGLAVQIPKGFVGLIYPRSSISSNTTLSLANSVGVIDSDFRNEIKLRFRNLVFGSAKKYKIGDKIGQIVIIPYPIIEFLEVETLDNPNTRIGGFGSTDGKT